MKSIDLIGEDITEIMKENLKIVNQVKSIRSIFMNERFKSKINYEPYFQRNYVWDNEKATYFIESVILGTEIPPLVLFQTKTDNEVIDGRQRYETLDKFIGDKHTLTKKGLRVLTDLAGKKFSQLSEEIRETITNTKIRILQCSVVNEPNLNFEKEDKIKKEIFRRYNSGIAPLKKQEIERAAYIYDELTKKIEEKLKEDSSLLSILSYYFLPIRSKSELERDKINILVSKIRTLIVLPMIPIEDYLAESSRTNAIQRCYDVLFKEANLDEIVEKLEEDIILLDKIIKVIKKNPYLSEILNVAFYDVCFWGINILRRNNINFKLIDLMNITTNVLDRENQKYLYLWKDINNVDNIIKLFDPSLTYFRETKINGYRIVKNYIEFNYNLDLSLNMKNKIEFKKILNKYDTNNRQFEKNRLHKPDPSSVSIYDILEEMKTNKFLVRPNYQRSEVKNLANASYLLESVVLDIKLPPIFIFKRGDKIKEIVDGQQRILTFLGFLGKPYINELGIEEYSVKNKFKLKGLKILHELNAHNIDTINQEYVEKLLDYQLDIVEIDESQNTNFDKIDLFLRLNTKPYPIKPNSFEMWNAYIDKNITERIKNIVSKYKGSVLKKSDKRMKNEELITSLAFLNHELNKGQDLKKLLNIYVKNNKVCSRIKDKSKITDLFKKISTDNNEYLDAVNDIEEFLLKIDLLIEQDEKQFANFFHNKDIKYSSLRSDQNFYFLWIILRNVDITEIKEDKDLILEKIQEKNMIIENYKDENIHDLDGFINSLEIEKVGLPL
nr:DUF262 domain-containing protein [Tissierella praeacuta]